MPKARSINQNIIADSLPDFRSLGATLRIVILVNIVVLLVSVTQSLSLADILLRFIDISALLQPVLLTSLLMLYMLNRWLAKFAYWRGFATVVGLVMAITIAIAYLGAVLYMPLQVSAAFYLLRNALLSGALAAFLLMYFRMRAMSLVPALQEARLQALQARIRPHFLFNSINAVLSIVRSDPKRAETALEDMADLFRMAMGNSQELVPLRREIALTRQYLALEQLRLGERLQVNWQMDDLAERAMIPPLILQPLLENAVYHGIEPLPEGGLIEIRLLKEGNELQLDVKNPCRGIYGSHNGNKMALENIRERLALRFDVEAKYTAERGSDYYQVHIQLPYIKEESE